VEKIKHGFDMRVPLFQPQTRPKYRGDESFTANAVIRASNRFLTV